MMKHHNLDVERIFYRFTLGLVAGFLLGNHILPIAIKKSSCFIRFPAAFIELQSFTKPEEFGKTRAPPSGLIYIGMMSMDDKMESRVEAAIGTWMKNPNPLVKIEVFANNNGSVDPVKKFRSSYLKNGFRVLQLPGVSDHVYPPQKKSFSMVKFMHDEYLHRYDWFVRLDDDAYVDTEKLVTFLSRINSSNPIYLGHAGYGKHNEDFLDVEKGENYCMGGTGMVFSKGLLQKFAPRLKDCLRNLLTGHEDIELGRCVQKMSGVKCTTSWETSKLFYQNFKNGTYAHNMIKPEEKKIEHGVLFHANKDSRYQHNFHVKLLNIKMKKLLSKIGKLENEIRREYKFNKDRYDWASNSYSHLRWDAIIKATEYKYNDREMKMRMHKNLINKLMDNTNIFVKSYQKSNPKPLKKLRYAALESSYHVVNPLLSSDVISKVVFTYSYKRRRYPQHKVNHYIHQRQYFSPYLHFFQEPKEINIEKLNEVIQRKLNREFSSNERKPETTSNIVPINFLTALSGRLQNVERFLRNFEETFLKTKVNTNLIIVYFPSNPSEETNQSNLNVDLDSNPNSPKQKQTDLQPISDADFIRELMSSLQQKYPENLIKLVTLPDGTEFSRAIGLQEASKHVTKANEILFFCDVDLVFAPELVERIRWNTVHRKRVYYPVFFSQFDPDVVYVEREKPQTPFHFDELDGFWRFFSYGMFSIYKSDFDRTKGFNVDIHGWGLEDVEMLDSVLQSRLDIFQCTDPALVHIFHDKYCDPKTANKQYTNCHKTKLTHYGPKTLMYYLFNAPEVDKDIMESN